MYLFTLAIIAFVAFTLIRAVRQVRAMMTPPSRVHLVPVSPNGRHAAGVKLHARDLDVGGFQLMGTYRVDPMKGVFATAYTHPGHRLCAVVYTHPVAGTFVDVCAKSESGQSFTVTTAPLGGGLDQPPGHEKVHDAALDVKAMVDVAMKKRPMGAPVSWSTGNFARMFEEAYAQEMDWRAGRGGVTVDEVRRAAHTSGHHFSERQILSATHKLQRMYTASRRRGVR